MLPTQSDFGDLADLDTKCAWDHFGNKTLDEAEALFRENSIHYYEDLMWMGIRAFHFYFPSVVHYIYSEDSAGDSDIISCIAGMLEFRRDHYPESLTAISGTIISLCDYVLTSFSRFNVEKAIYGDLRSRYVHIQKATEQDAAANP